MAASARGAPGPLERMSPQSLLSMTPTAVLIASNSSSRAPKFNTKPSSSTTAPDSRCKLSKSPSMSGGSRASKSMSPPLAKVFARLRGFEDRLRSLTRAFAYDTQANDPLRARARVKDIACGVEEATNADAGSPRVVVECEPRCVRLRAVRYMIR